MKTSITAFYRGTIRHPGLNLSLDELLDRSDAELWALKGWSHWLFPLRKPSNTYGGPTLSEAEVQEFRHDADLRRRFLRSLQRVLALDGLSLAVVGGKPAIARAADFEAKSATWIGTYGSQNSRVSRILQSLMLLGLPEIARALLGVLAGIHAELPAVVGQRSFEFWKKAVEEEDYWNSST